MTVAERAGWGHSVTCIQEPLLGRVIEPCPDEPNGVVSSHCVMLRGATVASG